MNWLILTLLAGVCSIAFNVINRATLKDTGDATAYAWWFEVLRLATFMSLLPFDAHLVISTKSFLTLLFYGLIELVAVILFMRMHKNNHLSLSSIVSQLRLIWTPILAFFILSEKLTLPEYGGIIVLFCASVLAANIKSLRIDKGVQIAFLFSLVAAVNGIVAKQTTEFASRPLILIAMALPSVIIIPFMAKSSLFRMQAAWKKHKKSLFTTSLINSTSMYLLVYALSIGTTTKVMNTFSGFTVLSVIPAILILKERDHLAKRLTAACLTIIGITLLA